MVKQPFCPPSQCSTWTTVPGNWLNNPPTFNWKSPAASPLPSMKKGLQVPRRHVKPKNRQDLIWDVAKDVAFMNSTEAGKKSSITLCLEYTWVSKYLATYNALVELTVLRAFRGSVTLTQIQTPIVNLLFLDPASFEQRQQNKIL